MDMQRQGKTFWMNKATITGIQRDNETDLGSAKRQNKRWYGAVIGYKKLERIHPRHRKSWKDFVAAAKGL